MKDLNKYVLLVMKWLNDKDSVTQQELIDNRADADAYAAYAAAYAAANAAYAAAAYAADDAEKWVGKYFERSGDNKQDYIDALKGDVKTTMDAVNEYEGDWANAKYGDIDVKFIFVSKGEGSTWPKGMLVGDHENHSPSVFDEVCTREEFNQLVSECETNFGASVSYAEYKKLYNSVMGESPLETPLDDNSKPVYTKEMADNGVMPSVGMECLIMYSSSNYKGTITYMGKGVGAYHSKDNDKEYTFAFNSVKFKPIDTRTDKEKAIDDIRSLRLILLKVLL